METNIGFIPRDQASLYLWAKNLIIKIFIWATDIKFNELQMDKPLYVSVLPNQKMNFLFALFPGLMPVKIQNTGISSVNASISPTSGSIGSNPLIIIGGQTSDTTVSLLGGDMEGNHYLNFGNTNNDPATLILYIPRYGHSIISASKIIYDIDYTNALAQTMANENAKKEANRITEIAFLHEELGEVKGKKGINPQIIADMDIGPKRKYVNEVNSTPTPVVTKLLKSYSFLFNRKSVFKGVMIFRQRPNGELIFVYYLTTKEPYIDSEPMVNGTVYKFYYTNAKDKQVGNVGTYTVAV